MAPLPPTLPDSPTPVFELSDEQGYENYFHDHGFVVVGGALSDERVDATLDELFESTSLLGRSPQFRRDSPDTWGGEDWPAGCRNFLEPLEPCAEVESWRNRCCPTVQHVFEVLWRGLHFDSEADAKDEPSGKLVVSIDRFGVMRPTKVRIPGGDGGDIVKERREWKTNSNWLHFDQNPWSWPGVFGVQGFLALTETTQTSGGFVTVPCFHKGWRQWCEEHPKGSLKSSQPPQIPVPMDDEAYNRRMKILVPKGALLVWDSRMPHENFPNEDESWRAVQYVTYKRLDHEHLRNRAEAWRVGISNGLVPASFGSSFSAEEQARLGMATLDEDVPLLREALEEGHNLTPEFLEAACKMRRAYRLKQIAMMPEELKECKELFQAALSVNPRLRETFQRVAVAEELCLPLWIL